MKKILLLIAFFCASAVAAQELFPELAEFGGKQKAVAKPIKLEKAACDPSVPGNDCSLPELVAAKKSSVQDDALPMIGEPAPIATSGTTQDEATDAATQEETVEEEVDLFATSQATEEVVEEEVEAEEEEEEEEEEPKIIIYMEAAKSTMTPNRNFSYCFGALKFANTMKRPVQALDVVLTYGPYPSKFNVRNLVKGKEQKASLTLMGETCAHIMEMPEVQINRCVVENMEENTCKKKVEFLPLRGS